MLLMRERLALEDSSLFTGFNEDFGSGDASDAYADIEHDIALGLDESELVLAFDLFGANVATLGLAVEQRERALHSEGPGTALFVNYALVDVFPSELAGVLSVGE